jgi:hypothetical protein
MKNIRWLLIGILLVCGVIYVGDFVVSAGHPFAELGAGFGCFVVSSVSIFAARRSRGQRR